MKYWQSLGLVGTEGCCNLVYVSQVRSCSKCHPQLLHIDLGCCRCHSQDGHVCVHCMQNNLLETFIDCIAGCNIIRVSASS